MPSALAFLSYPLVQASSVLRRVPFCRVLSSKSKSRSSRQSSPPRKAPNKKRPRLPLPMKVAVVGCAHGELDSMYAAVEEIERAASTSVDLIVCAGDFQAVRNKGDLQCLACPPKYRDMRSFWKYYAGMAIARVPTIFIGGNHEASNYLQEMPLGGLVAPNMYFLGNSGVINYRGLRIAGLSGVYVEHNYSKGRHERPPYVRNQIKTVYHTRKEDVDRLSRLNGPIDLFLSHDWPRGIAEHGNIRELLAAKPFLTSEIYSGSFGNPAAMSLLNKLKPEYWFSAHVHVKYAAVVKHENASRNTKFLALDKIIPRRDFIQLVDIPVREEVKAGNGMQMDAQTEEFKLCHDPEWLTVLRTEGCDPERDSPVTPEEMKETVGHLKNEKVALDLFPKADFYIPKRSVDQPMTPNLSPESFQLQPRTRQLYTALGLPMPTDDFSIGQVQDPVEQLRQKETQRNEMLQVEITPDPSEGSLDSRPTTDVA